jgi:uncharacterized protein (TIGR02594 family)
MATAPQAAIDKDTFFKQLGFAARTFGANRDYLYAVAVIESGVQNIKGVASDAFGPFQFLPSTWNDLVAKHGAETGVTEADITDPGAQTIFAAIYSSNSQQALTKALGHVPTGAELYMAHLLGPAGASAVLSADIDQAIDIALRAFYKGTALGEGFVDKVLSANSGLLLKNGQPCTTREVLDRIATKLNGGLVQAADLAARLGPPVTDTPGNQGDPPWLKVALAELAKGVVEDKTPGGSNPEIEKYFTATTFGPASDDVPWCAAFVSFCMANSGNAKVVAGNKRSAGAPDWLGWGFSVGRPARGAVAVVSPVHNGTPGHVGIVTGEAGTTIKLLAGNQRDAAGNESVCEVNFLKTDVLSYRWLDF